MIIDSHQHFWRYEPARYRWISDGMEILKHDFLPADLAEDAQDLVDAGITVQARQDLDETRWLVDIARDEPFVAGVVGWAPLTDPALPASLDELTAHGALLGIRHVLQDEPDDAFALRDDFNRGVAELGSYGLTYDILIHDRHLPVATQFVDRHPDQIFVLDHLAKPRIREGEHAAWAENIREFARRENCYCKLSGMVTEAHWNDWSKEDLSPYLDTVMEAFGPPRLMFGSDWPVCLLASDYRGWYHLVDEFTSTLSGDEQNRIWGETAAEAYGLEI